MNQENQMKILCLSDTHTLHYKLDLGDLSDIDCIVHTGDFSNGDELSTDNFLCWFADLPVKYKVLVAGNHDIFVQQYNERFRYKCLILGITYLQDSGCELEGIKFWGTPWTTIFYNWAFMCYEKDLSKIYKLIPKDVQVLLTHGPAKGLLDFVERVGGGHVGAVALRDRIKKLPKLKYHIFGHIHCGAGVEEVITYTNKYTAVNASILDDNYKVANVPIVIEIQEALSLR